MLLPLAIIDYIFKSQQSFIYNQYQSTETFGISIWLPFL